MSEPLLSVIIPMYGVEKYISQCLESVITQTYKNLEIIVINDGTLDNSALIAKEYADKDKRIKVYDFPNGGVSIARNRGEHYPKGNMYIFLIVMIGLILICIEILLTRCKCIIWI